MAANEQARRREWSDNEYTLEEMEGGVENVVTGLRRGMGEESESESESESEEEEIGEDGKNEEKEKEKEKLKPMGMEDLLKFMAKGEERKQ